MSDIYDRLSEPFPQEMERTVSKGGASLTYLPIAEVTNRMNRVLGVSGWSSEILRCERDASDPDWVVAHVRITAVIDGNKVIHDGFGGQKIKRTKNGDIVDLGDEFKGAVSDALKKAAQQLGVGLYLARSEEALAIEDEEAKPAVDPAILEAWEKFLSIAKSLDETQRNELTAVWNEYSDGAPKPTLDTATLEDLAFLSGEAFRITMGGEWVEPDA